MKPTSRRGTNRNALSVLGMLVPLVLMIPAAGAAPPSAASGTIVVGSPGFDLIRSTGGPAIYMVTEHDTYAGTLVGVTVGESTLRLDASGNFTLEGRHLFSGTVGDASGTLVLVIEAQGTFPTSFDGRIVILNGTDGLANLRGEWTLEGVPGYAGTYSGEIHFQPA